MIGSLVWGRIRIKIRVRVRVGIMFNVSICHRSNCDELSPIFDISKVRAPLYCIIQNNTFLMIPFSLYIKSSND